MEIVGGAALSLIGFTASGIVKGSLAAITHAAIGVVKASTFFAGLQSAGALGAGGVVTAIGAVTAGLGILGAVGVAMLLSK
jgi:hypothetical protein